MDKREQRVEGSTFAQNPLNDSNNGTKSKENENQNETGYTSIDGNFKLTDLKIEKSKSENIGANLKGNLLQNNEPLSSYHSSTGIYLNSNDKIEDKNSKGVGATFSEYPPTASVGLKSTVNQPFKNKPNLTASTGYNSMEGEYSSSTKIENKESKEGASFAEYPQTSSFGIKSTVAQPAEAKASLSTSSYNSSTGGYSSSTLNFNSKNLKEGVPISQNQQNQPVIHPLIVQVPSNAPIINKNNIPLGNVQGSVTFTSTTTTTTTTNSRGINPLQPPNVSQQMPFNQPLGGSTFAEYPQTVSHGIKSSNLPSSGI